MKRLRRFKIRKKIVKVFQWIIRSRRKSILGKPRKRKYYNPISKLLSLARHVRRGAKELCFPSWDPGQIQLGRVKPVEVPKGHLAVYIGESDDEAKRVLVPVIYFNHPLFGELLKEAEQVYGFNHPGGITLPCGISEFEKVQMRIATWSHRRRRKRPLYC